MNTNDVFDMGSTSNLSDSVDEIPMELDLTAAGPPISDDEDELDLPEDRGCKLFLQYAKRAAMHVGLVVLLCGYLMGGATMFYLVEGPNELVQREFELNRILGTWQDFQDHIWNITQDVDNRISREAFNTINQEYFRKLINFTFISYHNQYITARHILNETRGEELLWTFPNSVFFATTVITTIGYGNLVPTTTIGRICCIFYALIGIPLLLVTIADIGKFLSEFLSFLYRSYRAFKRKVRRQSRKISHHYRSGSQSRSSDQTSHAGSMNLNDIESESESSMEDELRIPVFMVLLVLLAYTAIGGILFQHWENMEYFEAFYFCFITMATVGFGDIVPTEQVYMFFTMAYIIFGLSLATMCIDLAGTEYIRKIHYLGSRMEDAKGAVISGIQVGEHIFKHTGVEAIRSAGGKVLKLRRVFVDREGGSIDYVLVPQKNIIYEPPSSAVLKLTKEANIKIMPDDITEKDGYIVQNKSYDKKFVNDKVFVRVSQNQIHRSFRPAQSDTKSVVIPVLLPETKV
ncbi:unnamed protein product, partial [Mesorhabditis belari]|uniref:Potassium channel domain-containing protein n=1 Tax=Mesorhabditis belari TaxID=2138241 RepID=A0AAF3EGV7_9BILA